MAPTRRRYDPSGDRGVQAAGSEVPLGMLTPSQGPTCWDDSAAQAESVEKWSGSLRQILPVVSIGAGLDGRPVRGNTMSGAPKLSRGILRSCRAESSGQQCLLLGCGVGEVSGRINRTRRKPIAVGPAPSAEAECLSRQPLSRQPLSRQPLSRQPLRDPCGSAGNRLRHYAGTDGKALDQGWSSDQPEPVPAVRALPRGGSARFRGTIGPRGSRHPPGAWPASRCRPEVSPASSVPSPKARNGWHPGRPDPERCPAVARSRMRRGQGHKAMLLQVSSSWLVPLLW